MNFVSKKKNWLYLPFFVFCLITTSNLHANSLFELGESYFKTIAYGELDLTITTVTQDANNFVWIGTYNGLYKYDGYKVKRYTSNPTDPRAIGGNFIRALWADPDGSVWVGTMGAGLSKYDPSTDSFINYPYGESNNKSISDRRVESILGDENGFIWVATNNGLDRLDPDSGQVSSFLHDENNPNSLSNNRTRSLLIDHDSNLWVGTASGLNRLSNIHSEVENYRVERIFAGPADRESLADKNVFRTYQSSNNTIWLGTHLNGAYWFDPSQMNLNKVSTPDRNYAGLADSWVHAITEDFDGNVWIGTYGEGIFLLDQTSRQVTHKHVHDPAIWSSINSNVVSSLLTDDSGIIWVGTWGDGLNLSTSNPQAMRTLRYSALKDNGLSHYEVQVIMERHNGEIWIGTMGNGVDIFDPQLGRVDGIRPNSKDPNALKDGRIHSMLELDKDTVWIGTFNGGLYRYQVSSKTMTHFSTRSGLSNNHINHLLVDLAGQLWVGTDAGIDLWDRDSQSLIRYPLKLADGREINSRLNTAIETKDGCMWAGTTDGLFLRKAEDDHFRQVFFNNPKGQRVPFTNSVYESFEDSNGEVWLFTNTQAFKLRDWHNQTADIDIEEVRFMIYAERGPLVNMMEDSQNRFWSFRGYADIENRKVITFMTADGIDIGASRYNAHRKLSDNLMMFGGTKGILMLRPEYYQKWDYMPKLVVSHFERNHQLESFDPSKPIVLAPTDTSFSIELASLDYSESSANLYRFKLENFDNEWIERNATFRTATYTNLAPGEYRFVAEGTNRVGDWSNHSINIKVIQLPHWHQTWWFRTILAVLICLLLVWLLKRKYGSVT